MSGIVTGAGRALANVWVTLTPVDASGIQVGDVSKGDHGPVGSL